MNRTAIAQAARLILSEVESAEGAAVNGWEFGDAPFSPPDAQGFVRSRDVEFVLVPKYGATIVAGELTTGGPITNLIDVPRLFHFAGADLGDSPQWVRDVVAVSTGGAAFRQNRPVVDLSGYPLDRGIRMAVPSAWTWEQFYARLDHRLDLVRRGVTPNAYGLREDELDIG